MNTDSTNTLYLVRHGENLANLTKEFSYKRVDYSLTPKGVLQAEQTSEFFKRIALDVIYASPLKRARETGEIIARPHQLPVTIVEEFREINVGNLEQMPPTAESWQLYGQVYTAWIKGNLAQTFPGGESFLELVERARRGLLTATRGRSNSRILIAAHGGIFIALASHLCPNVTLNHPSMHNCSVTEIELYTRGESMCGTLRRWSDIAHLSGEAANLVSGVPDAHKRA